MENKKIILDNEFVEEIMETVEIPEVHKETIMFCGPTGSGKTFNAIKHAREISNRFIIAVPTRQLAYEVFLDYNLDFVYTGEVHLGEGACGVGVYENIKLDMIDKIDTLIIDEAHFINDQDRGGELLEKIAYAISQNKNIILMTATDSIAPQLKEKLKIKEIHLKPFEEIQRIDLGDIEDVEDLLKKDPSLNILVFTKYAPNEATKEHYCWLLGVDEDKCEVIHAGIPSADRLLTQIKFRKGELQMVISSNVLAQGVNFPADIVIVEYNEWDTPEVIEQKLGRAGRPGFGKKYAYRLAYWRPDIQKQQEIPIKYKKIAKVYARPNGEIINIKDWDFSTHEVPVFDPFEPVLYRNVKYSKRFLLKLQKEYELLKEEKEALELILKEEERVKNVIEKYHK